MDLDRLYRILLETELPVVYDQFEEEGVPPLPWIVYYETDATTFSADNHVYFASQEVAVELYTEKKDPDTEQKLEDVLDYYEFYYSKSESSVLDEGLCLITYTIVIY